MKKILIALVLIIVLPPLLLAGFLKVRYGGGGAFPDLSGRPEMPASTLEVVANLQTPPGNIAVSNDGRVFITLHPEAHPAIKVAELHDGKVIPYPSDAFQSGNNEPRYFRSVLSLRIDRQNQLWTLDYGNHGVEQARLLAFDLATNKVVHEFVFPRAIAGLGSNLNDFQVSPDGKAIYIADASFFAKTPAIIVYDVDHQAARRLLEAQPGVTAEKYVPVVQGRQMVAFGLVAIRPGVDSIALDRKGDWLYFAPVTNRHLYRIRTRDLLDSALDANALAQRVETYAPKTMSDGITSDSDGDIYLTDPEHSAVMMLDNQRYLHTLLKDNKLRWPDGFSFGPDGWLYLTCSSLQQVIGLSPSSVKEHAPYQVFRFKPGHEAVAGH